MAVPTIVSSQSLGSEQRSPASDRIAVAIIGCGKISHDYHLPALVGMGDVQVVAVCDVDTNRRLHAQQVVANLSSGRTSMRFALRLRITGMHIH